MNQELTIEQHLERVEKIFDHISRVQENCFKLSKELIKNGQQKLARQLMRRAICHDNTKFLDLEYYGMYSDDEKEKELAILSHRTNNPHHLEHHIDVLNLSEVDLCEMSMDLYSRSQEFSTSVKEYLKNFIEYRKISHNSKFYKGILKYLNMVLEKPFS